MTSIGAPAILNGDEAGLWGGVRSQKLMPWADQSDAMNTYMLEYNRRLIAIGNSTLGLQSADCRVVFPDKAAGMFAFSRTWQNRPTIVVINNGDRARTVRLPITGRFRDLLN